MISKVERCIAIPTLIFSIIKIQTQNLTFKKTSNYLNQLLLLELSKRANIILARPAGYTVRWVGLIRFGSK